MIVKENSIEPSIMVDSEYDDCEFKEIKTLFKGEAFGELALMSNKPRAATIQCCEDCKFAVLNKADYLKLFSKLEKKKLNTKISFLKSVPYFSKWTNMALSKFCYDFSDRFFIRNQIVFKEGQKCEYVYIVKYGEFELTKSKF